jgi:UDP-N-acetylmuramyl pentapeptide phosphotransferase/UDP-N-acetylglucosamine-1-phosphate transferase
MTSLLLIFVLILSFTTTIVVRKIALRRNILDVPNIRSSHTQPTPRGGGIAILLAWYSGLFCLKYFDLIESALFYALISGVLLAFVSLLDDIYTIKPYIRILFQLFTVLLGLYLIGGLKILYLNDLTISIPLVFNIVIVLGAIWFINLYNFLDGIDGYASAEAIAVLSGMFLINRNPLFPVLIFALIGFLIWNWPKAKIFMGDIGSTQLGYILIILGFHFNNEFQINFIGWLILTSLFWFDATLTLFYRWRNKEKLSQAHRKHYYQRIVQYGFSHLKTVIVSIIINLVYISLVILSEKGHVSYFITFPFCILINIILARLIDKRLPFGSL